MVAYLAQPWRLSDKHHGQPIQRGIRLDKSRIRDWFSAGRGDADFSMAVAIAQR